MSTKHLVLVAFFVTLTAIGARIEIPLPYVPFTLQTFFVLLAGMLLGSRYGAVSQGIYVIIGLLGLPVFARGGGIGYVLQPTFGYLIGFIPAAYGVGWYIEKRSQPKRSHFLVASFVGLAIVYLFGLLYLWVGTNVFVGKELDFLTTVKVGLLLLIPGAIVKAFLAAMVGVEVYKRLGNEIYLSQKDV